MAARKNFTNDAPKVNFSLEYVRRGKTGLELVKVANGKETTTPVQVAVKVQGRNRLMVGIEPRAVFVTVSGRQTVEII